MKLYYFLIVLIFLSCTISSHSPRVKTTTGYFYRFVPRGLFVGDLIQVPVYTYVVRQNIYYTADRTGHHDIYDSLPIRYDSLNPHHARLVMNDTAFYKKK